MCTYVWISGTVALMLIISSASLRQVGILVSPEFCLPAAGLDRAGNFAVVGCIQLDDSQQDWVYGLGAVVFGYDVDRIKTLNSCYTYALGAKRIPYLRCPLWYATRASCTFTAYNRRWHTTIPLGSGLSPSVTLANYSGISSNGSRSAYPTLSILVAVSS